MATSNFSRLLNADKYYTVLLNRDVNVFQCEECNSKYYEDDIVNTDICDNCGGETTHSIETEYPDEIDVDCLLDTLGHELKELKGYSNKNSYKKVNRVEYRNIGEFNAYNEYGDIYVDIVVTALLESGYYEGARLDFLVEISNGTYTYEIGTNIDNYTLEEALDQIFEWDCFNTSMNRGMCTIQQRNAKKWAEEKIQEFSKNMNDIFHYVSEKEFNLLGTFSNGEAIYEEVRQ